MSSIGGVRLNKLAEVEQRQTPQTAETPDADAAVAGEKGVRIVTDRQMLARQELLCGDVFELP